MAALEVNRMSGYTETMSFCNFSFSYREHTVWFGMQHVFPKHKAT